MVIHIPGTGGGKNANIHAIPLLYVTDKKRYEGSFLDYIYCTAVLRQIISNDNPHLAFQIKAVNDRQSYLGKLHSNKKIRTQAWLLTIA